MDLLALQALSIPKIAEQLDELTVEQLRELRALEAAAESPRTTLLEKIDAKLEEAAEQQAAPAAVPADAAAEPDYLADDYTGPLTIPMAEARHAKARAAAEAAG